MENVWKKARPVEQEIKSSYFKILQKQIEYMNQDLKKIDLWATVVTVVEKSESVKKLIHAVHILPIRGDGYSYRLLELSENIGQSNAVVFAFSNPPEDEVKITNDEQFLNYLESVFASSRMTIVINQLLSINKEFNEVD